MKGSHIRLNQSEAGRIRSYSSERSTCCPQKPPYFQTSTSPCTRVWQANRSPASGSCGGNDSRRSSGAVESLTVPSTSTAQVPHVACPPQLRYFAVPLCGDSPASRRTLRRTAPSSHSTSLPRNDTVGMVYQHMALPSVYEFSFHEEEIVCQRCPSAVRASSGSPPRTADRTPLGRRARRSSWQTPSSHR